MTMATDALNICVESCIDEKRPIPQPCGIEEAKTAVERLLAELGCPADGEILYQYIPVIVPDNTLVRLSISMTKGDLEEIDYKANLFGMKRSKFLVAAARAFKEKDARGV